MSILLAVNIDSQTSILFCSYFDENSTSHQNESQYSLDYNHLAYHASSRQGVLVPPHHRQDLQMLEKHSPDSHPLANYRSDANPVISHRSEAQRPTNYTRIARLPVDLRPDAQLPVNHRLFNKKPDHPELNGNCEQHLGRSQNLESDHRSDVARRQHIRRSPLSSAEDRDKSIHKNQKSDLNEQPLVVYSSENVILIKDPVIQKTHKPNLTSPKCKNKVPAYSKLPSPSNGGNANYNASVVPVNGIFSTESPTYFGFGDSSVTSALHSLGKRGNKKTGAMRSVKTANKDKNFESKKRPNSATSNRDSKHTDATSYSRKRYFSDPDYSLVDGLSKPREEGDEQSDLFSMMHRNVPGSSKIFWSSGGKGLDYAIEASNSKSYFNTDQDRRDEDRTMHSNAEGTNLRIGRSCESSLTSSRESPVFGIKNSVIRLSNDGSSNTDATNSGIVGNERKEFMGSKTYSPPSRKSSSAPTANNGITCFDRAGRSASFSNIFMPRFGNRISPVKLAGPNRYGTLDNAEWKRVGLRDTDAPVIEDLQAAWSSAVVNPEMGCSPRRLKGNLPRASQEESGISDKCPSPCSTEEIFFNMKTIHSSLCSLSPFNKSPKLEGTGLESRNVEEHRRSSPEEDPFNALDIHVRDSTDTGKRIAKTQHSKNPMQRQHVIVQNPKNDVSIQYECDRNTYLRYSPDLRDQRPTVVRQSTFDKDLNGKLSVCSPPGDSDSPSPTKTINRNAMIENEASVFFKKVPSL